MSCHALDRTVKHVPSIQHIISFMEILILDTQLVGRGRKTWLLLDISVPHVKSYAIIYFMNLKNPNLQMKQ